MRIRRFSVQRTCLVLLAWSGVLALGAGCSDTDTSRVIFESAPEASTGQLELALTARGASGSLYRLRQAFFNVTDLDFSSFPPFLSSENDPFATTLEATLETGDYAVDLFFGWFLEKVTDGQVTRVNANLLSSSTQFFSIQANEETSVSYRFETNGEVIEFGQGRLILQIEVEERGGGSSPDGGVGQPDGGVGEGAPLELVSGIIFPESNPHGIGAVLFPATSPLNASLEITSDTGSICVRGEVGIVQNGDFANQWGALVGLDLAAFTGVPWDLDGGNVTGFAFNVSGPAIPPLRLAALPGGSDPTVDNFCRILDAVSQSDFEVPFDSLDRDCWNGVRDPMLATSLANVNWMIPADEFSAHAFDFCVSDLRPILR